MSVTVTITVTTHDSGDVQVTREGPEFGTFAQTDAMHVGAVLDAAVAQVRKAYGL